FAVAKAFSIKVFYGLVCLIYALIPGKAVPEKIFILFKTGGFSFSAAMEEQLVKAEDGTGSVFTRINTYMDTIKETFTQSYGLGFGPSSYTGYMYERNDPALLVSPHCFWTEILFQYGVIVFACFLGALIYCFVRLIKQYQQTQRQEYLLILIMDLIFVFACFASSSYLQFEYLWLPVGISLAFSSIRLEKAPR
ncbi:MAG: hypothetical protein RR626_02425, partial [Anaerovoracaceae bacterium]